MGEDVGVTEPPRLQSANTARSTAPPLRPAPAKIPKASLTVFSGFSLRRVLSGKSGIERILLPIQLKIINSVPSHAGGNWGFR
jgi:hypothetical protein